MYKRSTDLHMQKGLNCHVCNQCVRGKWLETLKMTPWHDTIKRGIITNLTSAHSCHCDCQTQQQSEGLTFIASTLPAAWQQAIKIQLKRKEVGGLLLLAYRMSLWKIRKYFDDRLCKYSQLAACSHDYSSVVPPRYTLLATWRSRQCSKPNNSLCCRHTACVDTLAATKALTAPFTWPFHT